MKAWCVKKELIIVYLKYKTLNFKKMSYYDNLDTYNGEAEHDMWVDYDNYENTGTPDVFDEGNLDDDDDNLNDGY